MNLPKYLLLSVVCTTVSLLNAQEPITAKAEAPVAAKTQEPVVAQTEKPVEPQPAVNDRELPKDQDADFAEWTKQLELSDEERSQFLAEMDADTDKTDNSLEVDKHVTNDKQETSSPEVKTVPVETVPVETASVKAEMPTKGE